MEVQIYYGYQIWGYVILQQDEIMQFECFVVSGMIMQNNWFVEVLGVFGVFDIEDDVCDVGFEWVCVWIDNYS